MKQASISTFFGEKAISITANDKKRKVDVIETEVSQMVTATTNNATADISSRAMASPTVINPITSNNFVAPLTSTLNPDWYALLRKEFEKPYFNRLINFVEAEMKAKTVYPPRNLVFNAFNSCPLDKIKVVIIGQDPYHGINQAHGLAFSVQKGIDPPPSLKNIYKVAMEDVNIRKPLHGNLESWSNQGVFLLNTCLTVRKGEAFSHNKQGWETFTDEVIRIIAQNKTHLVFILWGKPAQAKCESIDKTKHFIITSSHPSPLGATKTNEPFMSSRCFSRCNDKLKEWNLPPIDWNIPN